MLILTTSYVTWIIVYNCLPAVLCKVGIVFAGVCSCVSICVSVCLLAQKSKNNLSTEIDVTWQLAWICVMINPRSDSILVIFNLDLDLDLESCFSILA